MKRHGSAMLAAVWIGAVGCAAEVEAKEVRTAVAPVEHGKVNWLRNFDQAVATSQETGKPLFVLFTEVPGCQTVRSFGEIALSHPLLVEAIESEFVPVAIYNNVEGTDRAVLNAFGEPTWNNPVVRIIDAERRALAPRFAGEYSIGGLARNMLTALEKTGESPTYLRLVAEEEQARASGAASATFGMYCFWSGEAKLGQIDGVIATQPGFLQGAEVVEVLYDPNRIGYRELLGEVQKNGAATSIYTRSENHQTIAQQVGSLSISHTDSATRPSHSDDKYQLAHNALRFVPMTPLQATRVNAALSQSGDPHQYLSPQQISLAARVVAHPKAGWSSQIGTEDLQASMAQVQRINAGIR